MTANSEIKTIPSVSVSDDELQTQTTYHRYYGTIVHPSDATTIDQMNVVEISGTLEFWGDPEEDLYAESDGHAV